MTEQAPRAEPSDRAGRRRQQEARAWGRTEQLVIAAALTLYVAFIWFSSARIGGHRTWTLFDDAMISLRYARNLTDGHGLAYNAGDNVEGYTNLGWTLILAAVQVVARNRHTVSGYVAMIGAFVLVAQMLVVRAFARLLSPVAWVPTVAIAATGFGYGLLYWTLRGMEVGLIGLLVTSAAYLTARLVDDWQPRRLIGISLLSTAAVFTRDDAAVAVVVIGAAVIVAAPPAQRRRVGQGVPGFLVALAMLRLGLRQVMYGEWLPNTYHLKVDGIPRSLLLERGALSVGYLAVFGFAVPLMVAVFAFVDARGRRRITLAMLAGIVVGQIVYTATVGGDAWEYFGFADRFLATVTGPLMVLAAVGVGNLSTQRGARVRGLALPGVAAGVVLVATLAFVVAAPRRDVYFQLGNGGLGVLTLRVAMLLAAAALIAMACLGRRSWPAVALAGLIVVTPNLIPFAHWLTSNHHERGWDISAATAGTELRRDTMPDASIATPAIGSSGFFSNRRIIDVLGKVDKEVARTPPHLEQSFRPGHVRWDYRHSYRDLHPDVIAGAWVMTPKQLANLSRWGYGPTADRGFLLVREGSRVRGKLAPMPGPRSVP